MTIRTVLVVLLSLGFGNGVVAQSTAPPAQERSHVERFSTPEVRAERSEAEAGAKLAVNPNDDQALNERAVARMRLGRYEEAQAD